MQKEKKKSRTNFKNINNEAPNLDYDIVFILLEKSLDLAVK